MNIDKNINKTHVVTIFTHMGLFVNIGKNKIVYLKPTAACHTKANNKKNKGITGKTSTKGLKIS